MKVLAVEDQASAAIFLLAVLRATGFEAEHVEDSTQALARITAGGYRVVVSDWMMPEIDGLELCKKVRALGGAYVYFILVSSRKVTKENRQKALDAGVDDFLVKPIDPDELSMRLHVAERIIGLAAQVKQLESFIPICGYCKKIRDDQRYWQEVETYFRKHQGTQFSHGVCPDCYERFLVPQLEKLGIEVPPPEIDEPPAPLSPAATRLK